MPNNNVYTIRSGDSKTNLHICTSMLPTYLVQLHLFPSTAKIYISCQGARNEVIGILWVCIEITSREDLPIKGFDTYDIRWLVYLYRVLSNYSRIRQNWIARAVSQSCVIEKFQDVSWMFRVEKFKVNNFRAEHARVYSMITTWNSIRVYLLNWEFVWMYVHTYVTITLPTWTFSWYACPLYLLFFKPSNVCMTHSPEKLDSIPMISFRPWPRYT